MDKDKGSKCLILQNIRKMLYVLKDEITMQLEENYYMQSSLIQQLEKAFSVKMEQLSSLENQVLSSSQHLNPYVFCRSSHVRSLFSFEYVRRSQLCGGSISFIKACEAKPEQVCFVDDYPSRSYRTGNSVRLYYMCPEEYDSVLFNYISFAIMRGSDHDIPAENKDLNNGCYLLEFTASEEGSYFVAVMLYGQNIRGSPAVITVTSNHCDHCDPEEHHLVCTPDKAEGTTANLKNICSTAVKVSCNPKVEVERCLPAASEHVLVSEGSGRAVVQNKRKPVGALVSKSAAEANRELDTDISFNPTTKGNSEPVAKVCKAPASKDERKSIIDCKPVAKVSAYQVERSVEKPVSEASGMGESGEKHVAQSKRVPLSESRTMPLVKAREWTAPESTSKIAGEAGSKLLCEVPATSDGYKSGGQAVASTNSVGTGLDMEHYWHCEVGSVPGRLPPIEPGNIEASQMGKNAATVKNGAGKKLCDVFPGMHLYDSPCDRVNT